MNKFVSLYESSIQRYTRGGFLTGDLVKFADGCLKDDWFKGQGVNYLAKVKQFIDSGLNIRVSAIKAVRPTTHSGDVQNEADKFLVDVILEVAPGLYREFLTVPAHVLVPVDYYPDLAPVPDSLKRKGDVNIHPKPVEKSEDEETGGMTPYRQTTTSDLGDGKDSTGDRKLNNVNVVIPSSPAKDARSPAVDKSTARYLPKK